MHGTQEYTGEITDPDTDEVLIFLDNLEAGDTIYAMAFGEDDVDPYLIVSDNDGIISLAQDNNSGGDLNAAIAFDIAEDGDYVLGMFAVNGTGAYRIMVGVNDPNVLDERPIEAVITGVTDSIRGDETYVAARDEVQRFAGVFNDDDDEILVVFPDLAEGRCHLYLCSRNRFC